MERQKTILTEIHLKGAGLHTAHKVNVAIKPAGLNSGIEFIRVDLPDRPRVKVGVDFLLPAERSPRRTSVGTGSVEVQTVEHMLAALSGFGIDNAVIEIDNDELPGLDGSSIEILDSLQASGITELDGERQIFSLRDPIIIEENGSTLMALPCDDFKISYTLDYNHPRPYRIVVYVFQAIQNVRIAFYHIAFKPALPNISGIGIFSSEFNTIR